MGSFKIVLILAVLAAVAYAMESADPAAHELAIAEETSDLESILPSDLAMDEKKYKVYYKRKYKKKGGYRRYGGYGGGRGYGRGGGYGGRGGGGGGGGDGSSED